MPFSIRPYRRFAVQCPATYSGRSILKLSMAYNSGFWLLITLLALSSGPAYAEWVSIGSSKSAGGYTVYFDPDTIRRKGELVKLWQMYDYKTVQNKAGDSLLSMNAQQQYDCGEERTRLLAYAWYSDNMGKGQVVYSDSAEGKWLPVAPQSINEAIWKVACSKN